MLPNLPTFNPTLFKSSPISKPKPKPNSKNPTPILPPNHHKPVNMMGNNKHLHELLQEDQEPFLLKTYIFDRRSQLINNNNNNKPLPKTKPKKFTPKANEISNPNRSNLWKQACFISLHQSPDVRKSPWPATAKSSKNHPCSNCKRQNSAMLLEAARRITQNRSKPKTQIKNGRGFGLFGSVMKRLRRRSRKREMIEGRIGVEKIDFEMGFGCSCKEKRSSKEDNGSRRNSGASVSTRDKETCRRWEEIIGFGVEDCGNSPFRFSLERSHCESPRKPDFSSPVTSPRRSGKQEKCGMEGTPKTQLDEEKEQAEQCSPVSVLDQPFEDDEDGHEDGGETDGYEYDLDGSYAIVQRAKQKLLEKLLRFEKLALLDPIELEKRMLEDQEEEDGDDDEADVFSLDQFNSEKDLDRDVREVLTRQSKDSVDMKRLVTDLIAEESREGGRINDSETVVNRVCERLESWKEVESNTIDMMVELDFRREIDGWKRTDKQQVVEIAVEIEISIFGLLEEELYRSLVERLVQV